MLKLKKFEKNKRKLNSKYIIIASIMLIFMISMFALYKSYALYKVQEEYDANSDWATYSKRILGDATGEMGPFYYYRDADNDNRSHDSWYADVSYFVIASYPWFHRGGHYYNGVLAGQFAFNRDNGGDGGYIGLRLVLIK